MAFNNKHSMALNNNIRKHLYKIGNAVMCSSVITCISSLVSYYFVDSYVDLGWLSLFALVALYYNLDKSFTSRKYVYIY